MANCPLVCGPHDRKSVKYLRACPKTLQFPSRILSSNLARHPVSHTYLVGAQDLETTTEQPPPFSSSGAYFSGLLAHTTHECEGVSTSAYLDGSVTSSGVNETLFPINAAIDHTGTPTPEFITGSPITLEEKCLSV